jgi:type IV secretory pathway VirB4 component
VQVQPRRYSIAERSVLDRALTALYRDVDPEAPLEQMPILSDLVAALRAMEEPETEAHLALATDLRLFLSGSLAATFDAPTTVDWDFGSDINYFDFSETRVPRTLQAFFYGQAVGAINRYMHDPRRDRRRPTLLLIDEYHMVARTESVARMAAELAKFARKHRIAVMPVDQNPLTFLGEKWTRFIWENATGKALFHLDDLPAREVGGAIADLTAEHLDVLTHAEAGEAVLVLGNDVYVAHIETSPRETRAFAGS